MEWVEVTGKTIEEAKEAALDQLGVAEADAEVVILAEPKTGLFGRVRSEARVRARVRPVGPRPKRTRRPREREKSRSGSNQGGSRRDGNAGSRPSDGAAGEGGGSSSSSRRRRSRGSGRSGTDGAAAAGAAVTANDAGNGKSPRPSTKSTAKAEESEMAEGMTLEEQAQAAQVFLQGLMAEFGFDATVETRTLDEETVELAAKKRGYRGMGHDVSPVARRDRARPRARADSQAMRSVGRVAGARRRFAITTPWRARR